MGILFFRSHPLTLLMPLLSASVLLTGCYQATPLKRLDLTSSSVSRVVNAQSGALDASFCTDSAEEAQPNLKLLFVVDHSRSNRQVASGVPGTDETGLRRYGPILSYLSDVQNLRGVSAGLITFNDTAQNRMSSVRFTPDLNAFRTRINQVRTEDAGVAPNDTGWTNYLLAIEAAHRMIREDLCSIDQAGLPSQNIYSVIFLSDGRPQTDDATFQQPAELGQMIDRLTQVKVAPDRRDVFCERPFDETAYVDRIAFNAAYYYSQANYDANAKALLEGLALRAEGMFFEFPAEVDLSLLTPPNRWVRRGLKEVFVENASVIWENGNLLADSDGDGLSDERERELGSLPSQADSDGNGVSDFVEYSVYGKPCRDQCVLGQGTQFHTNLCRILRYDTASDGRIVFGSRTGDVLNDCERTLIRASVGQFSTHRGWVPDWLLFKAGINVTSVTPQELLGDLDTDSVSNIDEIKLGLPVRFPNAQISGLRPMRYRLSPLPERAGARQCYHLVVDDIPALQSNDRIRVFVTQGPAAITSRKKLNVIERRLSKWRLKFDLLDQTLPTR